MSSNMPYTLQDLQDRINTLVNNDSDSPATTDDEWTIRLNLINQSIGKWEGSQDIFWDELWTTYTHATPVADSDSDYVLTATDLRYPGGFVKLTLDGSTNWVEVISPEEAQRYRADTRAVYFTGNPSAGWTLNLCWTPATGDGTVGATISFPHYKYATRFTSASATTAKPEMSDPNYIVYDVAATKSLLESKNNQFSVFSGNAADCMDTMRVMNDIKPNYQNNNVDDVDALSFGAVIGD
ncbi:hypothetical protein E3A20_10510 [Planctomyces bekefii]|uniref:Uncharacterized protein n=1 Tax=Planctomyces bekefii TaxID=1653850 RepID=A0A5C6M6P8_9PLAN|nr:hypothetical protein E3A20_10510 [Planctomyces bekefii]